MTNDHQPPTTNHRPTPDEPSSTRLIATLGIGGFLSGLILVVAYLYTLPIIQANKAKALEIAALAVLPGSTSLEKLELRGGNLQPATAQASAGGETPRQAFVGFTADKKLVGFAIVAEEPGFQDIIGGIIGYDPRKKTIIGFAVLESKETPGLGDKIFKDEDFKTNFTALTVEPAVIAVKKGEKKQPNEVEAITGATISSKAVVRLLDKGIKEWKAPIEGYLKMLESN